MKLEAPLVIALPAEGAEDLDEVAQEPLSGVDLVADIYGAVEVRQCEAAIKLLFLGVAWNCYCALFN